MSTAPKSRLTPEQYLQRERAAETRSEFCGGEVFAMTGASRRHNLICWNIASHIHRQFERRECESYQNDMRVKVDASGLYTYPDIVATCGDPQFEDDQVDTLLNPQAIIEVLSDSTEAYDRGTKFAHYRKLASLQDYVLVSQTAVRVERYSRRDDGQWLFWSTDDLKEHLTIPSIECRLSIADMYARVDFDDSEGN